jgi:hypothetical protein
MNYQIMKKVFLLDSPQLPTPGTHMFTMTKFMSGFKYYGYETHIAKHLDDIDDGSIVLLSNYGMGRAVFDPKIGFDALKYLSKNSPNCVYIGWFFHEHIDKITFKKFILTGEHFRAKPRMDTHILQWNIQRQLSNYVPLTFASPLFPEQVGTLERNEIYNGCFVGTAYKPEWVVGLQNIVYIPGFCHGNEVKEDVRIKIFLSSKIAFGFHMNNNILNNVVVERVFEGMAFGCVVISDSLPAGEITGGIVQVATSREDFLNIYVRLLNNPKERLDLQKKGYEWVKNHGLYIHTVKHFLEKIKTL